MKPRRFQSAIALIGTLVMVIGLVLAVGLGLPGRASADIDPLKGTVTGLTCPQPRACTGFLAGVDGTALDTDLVLPSAAHYPLIVLVHGWGGNKGTGAPMIGYPGDAFFTDRGYAVLRYSTRGFGKSWGQVGFAQPDREIADIRSLVSAVVDDSRFGVQADKVGVTGASYGGGHSWLSAMQPTWSTPGGKPVRIAAVAPIASWTDLGESLMPNGRESPSNPLGTPKFSYVTGLFSQGLRADPERPYPNYGPEISLLFARALAGEPFQIGSLQDPLAAQLAGFFKARSVASYSDWLDRLRADPSQQVPIFVAQGWTDDLFPPIEPLRMIRALKSVNPDYPIKLYLGDIGHPRSANKQAELAYVTNMAAAWFDYWLKGQGPKPTFDVTAATTTTGDFDPSQVVKAPTLEALSSGVVTTSFGGPFLLVAQPVQTGGIPADPITPIIPLLGDALHKLQLPLPTGGVGGITTQIKVDDMAGGRPVWYEGRGTIHLSGTVVGGDAQYDVRLWDRDPNGAAVLVDRGTTKFVGAPGPIQIDVNLFGNAWTFQPGHTLTLDVTNVDVPYLRPNNLLSTTVLDKVTMDLPVRGPSATSSANSILGLRLLSTPGGGTPVAGTAQPAPAPLTASAPATPARPAGLATGPVTLRTAASESDMPPARRPWLAIVLSVLFLAAIAVAALRSRVST